MHIIEFLKGIKPVNGKFIKLLSKFKDLSQLMIQFLSVRPTGTLVKIIHAIVLMMEHSRKLICVQLWFPVHQITPAISIFCGDTRAPRHTFLAGYISVSLVMQFLAHLFTSSLSGSAVFFQRRLEDIAGDQCSGVYWCINPVQVKY